MTPQIDSNTTSAQDAARIALGVGLMTAGTSHLTFARDEFKAQVPPWVPLDPDTVVLASGVVEIALGAAIVFLPERKELVGRIAGAFFTCVFPGNIAQYTHHRDAFGWIPIENASRGFSSSPCWSRGRYGRRVRFRAGGNVHDPAFTANSPAAGLIESNMVCG